MHDYLTLDELILKLGRIRNARGGHLPVHFSGSVATKPCFGPESHVVCPGCECEFVPKAPLPPAESAQALGVVTRVEVVDLPIEIRSGYRLTVLLKGS